jgi:hypothetical protein
MCSRAWVTVAFICLIFAAVRVQKSGGAGPKADSKKVAPAAAAKGSANTSSSVLESWKVSGSAEKADVAEQFALEEARDKLVAFLAGQTHPLDWQPDLDYIRHDLVTEKITEKTEKQPTDPMSFASEKVTLTVTVTQKSLEDMQKQDKKFRVEQRQTFLAKALAGILAVLVAVTFYFRLDDATKGYYTTLLRVASLALVATVGAGVWFLM